jgi:type IV secretion system protein VirB6
LGWSKPVSIPCPVINPNAGGAQTLVSAIDCFVKSSVQDSYALLLGRGSVFSQTLTIALTLYIAVVGYRLIFGRSSLSLGEFAPKALLIGTVLALSSNWAAYQVLVFDVLTDGPQEVAMMIGPNGGSAQSITARVDAVSDRLADVAADWAAASAPQPTELASATALPKQIVGESLGPNVLLLSALLLVLASAGVLAVSKVLIGLLLAIGPIFVSLGLFAATRGLAFGWARVCILLALVPLLSLMTSAGALTMVEPMVVDMAVQAAAGEFSLRAAIALFVAVLVMVAVSFQLFRIATVITANWSVRMSERVAAPHVTSAASAASSPTAQQSTLNPRIDVLINALERSTITGTASGRDIRRQIVSSSALILAGDPTMPDNQITFARSSLAGRPASQRAPLKPVRKVA